MKQTAKRFISMLLSLLMIISMVSVYTFASNSNYQIDDEWYEKMRISTVIVNPEWEGLSEGDTVSYIYRNERFTESFSSDIHFSSIKDAYASLKNYSTPVIILCPGVYDENITLNRDVTFLGTNAGIDPNEKGEDKTTPWESNMEIGYNSVIRGVIEIDKRVISNIEVTFDGITFSNGFGYVDAGAKAATSSVVVKNSSFKNLGPMSYKSTQIEKIFYFDLASAANTSVAFENVRVIGMNTATLLGATITKFSADNMYYADSSMPLGKDIDALAGQNPEYTITNSMFYNNATEYGSIVIDHSVHEGTTRAKSLLEISDTVFLEGDSNLADADAATRPVITFVVADAKNALNIHDCTFIAKNTHSVSPLDIVFNKNALKGSITGAVNFNKNILIGYTTVNDTSGIVKASKLDFTGNYFSDAQGNQVDPVYPTSSSYKNIKIDYFWLNQEMTIASDIFHPTSIGYSSYDIDNAHREISLTIAPENKFNFNIKTNDNSVSYKVYANEALTKEAKTVNGAELFTGNKKNVFYAVAKSSKVPGSTVVYKIYVTVYNPKYISEFNADNTYMYSPKVAGMKNGEVICNEWDGTAYKFIVGKTVFATVEEIFEIADNPTIIMPAGSYTEQICISESATILGAKHGINPNVPQYDNPEKGWALNEDRVQDDQETVIEGVAMFILSTAVNAVVTVDGITFGQGSAFADTGMDIETYTTVNLKNIIVDNAGAPAYVEKNENGNVSNFTSSAIFSFGNIKTEGYSDNHKDVRLINIRMENQGQTSLLGCFFETLLIDGLYYAANSSPINKGEWSAPAGQNFSLTLRNSCFYKNTCSNSGGLFIVNNNSTDSTERKYNRIVVDNNIFYEATTYSYGLFGVRFNSAKDSLHVTNNTIICSKPNAIIPGNSGWFVGLTGTDKTPDEELQEVVSDVVIQFNRIIGPVTPIDLTNVNSKTLFKYNFNYFSAINSANYVNGVFNKNTVGVTLAEKTWGCGSKAECDYYYTDYDMKNLTTKRDDAEINAYNAALDYKINGNGTVKSTGKDTFSYTDSVSSSTVTYDFGINLKTKQASYAVYSDANMSKKVNDIVTLDKETNVFYIKFASANNSVVHTYTATITKKLSSSADIISIGKCSIADDKVTAIVPVGTDTLDISNIVVAPGASYNVFSDADCTTPYVLSTISAISTVPVYKYIVVTAQDGTTKKYTLSAVQGINTLNDVINIENAEKTSSTTFTATIPFDKTSFTLIPTFSDKAKLTITVDSIKYTMTETEPFTIHNIDGTKMVKLDVVSESGATKSFTLNIVKDKSSVDIAYIYNMYNNGDDTTEFSANTNASVFKVVTTFKNPATTYNVYRDKDCTQLYKSNYVLLTTEKVTAYLKATSQDGKTTKIYTLNITTSNPDPEVKVPSEGGGTVITPPDLENVKTFTDVPKDAWYKPYVDYSVAYGMFAGTSSTTFSPNSSITRAQFVQVLANLTGIEKNNNVSAGFTDVESGKWYTGAIKWAAENKIVSGMGNGKFEPDTEIDRQQMCVILVNYVERFMKKSLSEKVKYTGFADASDIAAWAKTAVEKCYKAELVKGVGDNKFAPGNVASRAEAATIFTKFHSNFFKMA